MNKSDAERWSHAVHNAKTLLYAVKTSNDKMTNSNDPDSIKLHNGLATVIQACTDIEYDLDRIPVPVTKKPK